LFAISKLRTIYFIAGAIMKTINFGGEQMIPFLGNRIQNARETRGFRASEIANKVGVTKGTWSLYESENRVPSLDTFKRIAESLNVSADYLLGLKEELTNLNNEEEN
jgi:transcriptional regulator with XRE-family HTH domain